MKKANKKLLSFSLILFFILITPLTIFYSQGYRFDFKTRKIVQTGGLFLKIAPSGARVYLDGKLIKKTNFLFDSVFLNDLLPETYQIRIEKDGYHSWEKNLQVEELKVCEAKSVVLFPKKINFTFLEKDVEEIFPSPTKKSIILKQILEDQWALVVFNSSNLQKNLLLEEKDFLPFFKTKKIKIVPKTVNFYDLIWSKNEEKIIVKVGRETESKFFLVDLSTKEITDLGLKENVKDIIINPQNSKEIYFLKKEKGKFQIYLLDRDLEQIPLILEPFGEFNVVSFSFLNGNIIWLGDNGFLYKGKVSKDKVEIVEILNLKPIDIKEADYKIVAINNSKIFLFEDKTLYYLNPRLHLIQQIFETANDISISYDYKKIAVWLDNQIWLFYLEPEYQQPQRIEFEKFLLEAFPKNLNEVFWLTPYYLVFSLEDGIRASEIDNRSRLNTVILSEFKNPKILWFPERKRLFALSENNLYFTDDILK
jgi:hypothetical protein